MFSEYLPSKLGNCSILWILPGGVNVFIRIIGVKITRIDAYYLQ